MAAVIDGAVPRLAMARDAIDAVWRDVRGREMTRRAGHEVAGPDRAAFAGERAYPRRMQRLVRDGTWPAERPDRPLPHRPGLGRGELLDRLKLARYSSPFHAGRRGGTQPAKSAKPFHLGSGGSWPATGV